MHRYRPGTRDHRAFALSRFAAGALVGEKGAAAVGH